MLEALQVQVANGYIYVAGNTSGLVVLRCHAESHIELVSQLGGYMNGVALQGNHAYAWRAARSRVGIGPSLVVLDKSTPSHPVVVGQTRPIPDIENVTVSGTYADVNSGGLRVVDVSNPANSQEVGAYTAGDIFAQGVAIEGRFAFSAYRCTLICGHHRIAPCPPMDLG